ncbi:hypothetical protein ACJRO7_005469 [Eucalyptus globulus]|uniref:Protein PIN-LIKES 7-like n=1 Tax=Eucalyptus globulus TaxID=34317 RepID=A0ABD3J2R9_EUCGL
MGIWTLFELASMPVLQVSIICVMGAFMATGRCNLLPVDTRKVLNKIVFIAFTPSLIFTSLTKTVTLQDIISCQLPLGNLGNLLLIIIPAVCDEGSSPFGNWNACLSAGLSYASFSMALGGFYIWTYTCQLIQTSSSKYKELQAAKDASKAPNILQNAGLESHLLKERDGEQRTIVSVQWTKASEGAETQAVRLILFFAQSTCGARKVTFKVREPLQHVLEELMSPPTLAAIVGFIVGAITFLKNLIIGEDAPLHRCTIPCITLILGGNLTQGLRSSRIRPWAIAGVICVHYVIPGDWHRSHEGCQQAWFSGSGLMVQFTLTSHEYWTMTQLFDVGQEECSVLFLWTYLFAAIVLTIWSTVYMWILS